MANRTTCLAHSSNRCVEGISGLAFADTRRYIARAGEPTLHRCLVCSLSSPHHSCLRSGKTRSLHLSITKPAGANCLAQPFDDVVINAG